MGVSDKDYEMVGGKLRAKGAQASIDRENGVSTLGAIVAVILICGGGYGVYQWLTAPDPKAVAAREVADKAYDAKRAAFEAQQAPLWSRPASTLTTSELGEEVRKCKAAAEAANPSPFRWVWGSYNGKQSLKDIRSGYLPEVTLVGAVKVEMLNKVMWADYHCRFRGAGFETVQKVDPRFSDHYPQDE